MKQGHTMVRPASRRCMQLPEDTWLSAWSQNATGWYRSVNQQGSCCWTHPCRPDFTMSPQEIGAPGTTQQQIETVFVS